MKKVIAVQPGEIQVLTSLETAEKNNWWITYTVEVFATENPKQEFPDNQRVPKPGMEMSSLGSRKIYTLQTVTPVEICWHCHKQGERKTAQYRVLNRFYCKKHYNKLVITKPIVKTGSIQNRNEPCACGSGKKFKNCCGIKAGNHAARHYFNSDYVKNQSISKSIIQL